MGIYFRGCKRDTILKISTDDKCFQFIAPDKDFGVKEDSNMYLSKNDRRITICFKDNELRLFSAAIDTKLDLCIALARDVQTGDIYMLIDKPGIE